MTDRELALVLVLLALAAPREGSDDKRSGMVSRLASRAAEAVVDVVDPDVVIEHVDVNAIIERVDINALLERVDVDALVDRIDVDRLASRIDIDAIIEQVDVKEIVDRAGVADIVRESTGELAGSALDIFRRQLVALDEIMSRATQRILRRDAATWPRTPPELADNGEATLGRKGRVKVTGHYAGPLTRLTAFLIDAIAIWASFLLIFAGIFFFIGLFTDDQVGSVRGREMGVVAITLLLLWALFYFWFGLALVGRSFGMAVVGLRVVTRQGSPISGRQGLVRTLVFPFSFLFFALGFLGIFTSPERRTMHDAAAGTTVVYDWGDRPAEISAPLSSWLVRQAEASGPPVDSPG